MHKKLSFLFLIVYWIVESEPFKPTIVYVNDGVNTTLNCDVDNYSASSWFGPCLSHNNRCSPKIPYYDGLIRDPMISSSISLQTSKGQEEGSYNLHISNVTSKNKGDYKCLGFKGKSIQIKRYELKLKVKPSNISIDNISFDGSIIGTEGKDLELVCSVISGVPKENMSWYRGLSLVKTGGPGNISYSFVPKRDDHGRTFSCAVQNEVLKKPLNKKVTLNIKYLPVVQTPARTQSVSIGNNFTLQCLSEGNPPAYLMRIRNKRTILKSCNHFTCSLTLISSRKNSGNYTCEAQNELGIVNETASVKVLYPPDVTISTTNNRELRCNADGEPKNTSFVAWKHFSEQETLLRLFKGSENLSLCSSCKTYEVNGVYVCEVTNGIPGSVGNKVTFGKKIVKLQGIPEILPSTKELQYGKYMEFAAVTIYIYSIPEITSKKILRNDTVIDEPLLLVTQTNVSVDIHGKTVMITGYTISKLITSVQESDFTNYTFVISNAKGSVHCTVILKAKDDFKATKTPEDTWNGTISREASIALSLGSGVFGTLIIAMLYRCYIFLKNRLNSHTVSQTANTNNEVQYDEINEIELRGDSDSIRQRLEDHTLFMESRAAEQSSIVIPSHVEDTRECSTRDLNADDREYIKEGNEWDHECSSSNSETYSYESSNSYINIKSNVRSTYESLIVQNRRENDTGSYDQVTRESQNSADYHNLRL